LVETINHLIDTQTKFRPIVIYIMTSYIIIIIIIIIMLLCITDQSTTRKFVTSMCCDNEQFPEGDRYVDSPTSCSKRCCLLKMENNVEQRSFAATKFELDWRKIKITN